VTVETVTILEGTVVTFFFAVILVTEGTLTVVKLTVVTVTLVTVIEVTVSLVT
jgi:hypothetical protein